MQPREKILAGVLIAVVVLWFGRPLVEGWLLEPIRELQQQKTALQSTWKKTEAAEFELLVDLKQLSEWEDLALPAEPLDAQRIYGSWLLSKLEQVGWTDVSMTPGRIVPIGKTAQAVQINLEGMATPAQFSQFVREFEQTPLLHRIERLTQDIATDANRQLLAIKVTAEGICISGKTSRPWPFESWKLASDFDPALDKSLEVTVSVLKPNQKLEVLIGDQQFRIKVDPKQTEIWKIEQAPETATQSFPAGTSILPAQSIADAEQSQRAMNDWLVHNPFFEPVPPAPFRPQLIVPATLEIVRGTRGSERFQLSGLGDFPYDSLQYNVSLELPEFVEFNSSSGELRWDFRTEDSMPQSTNTTASVEIDSLFLDQPVVVEQPMRIVFRDPNTAPTVRDLDPVTISSQEVWTYQVEATDLDQPSQRLSYALSGEVPAGLSINSLNGQLQWSPDAEQEGKDFTVTLTVTDNGTPALSNTSSLQLTVVHNAENSTELVACITADDRKRAWFVDRKTGKRYAIAEGEQLSIGLFSSEVLEIRTTEVLLKADDTQAVLKLGQKLQQRRTI